MKEAFWGVLIVVLGLFGVVVINIFQNVTVDNDRMYYLIKESTEAAAFDAIDLTYYSLHGDLRIVEDKFVENLTRRFAENTTIGNYRIIINDINEVPPKVSLIIKQPTLMNVLFNIKDNQLRNSEIRNRLNGVIETKYKLQEVLDFLGITEEEWNKYRDGAEIGLDSSGGKVCKTGIARDDMECIPGDIKFIGFEDLSVNKDSCVSDLDDLERKAKYSECECGKWSEEKTETIKATATGSGKTKTYTWRFQKENDIRKIDKSVTADVTIGDCTTDLKIMTPKDMTPVKPANNPNEPSQDNSAYIDCPEGGIKIPIETEVTLHPRYIPPTATNRKLKWESVDTNIIGITYSNPTSACKLNAQGSNCLSKARATANNIGETIVKATSTNNKVGTCKITVWDGTIDSLSCNNISLVAGEKSVIKIDYSPKNASKTDFTYTSSNTTVAKITGNAIQALTAGTSTITMRDPNTGKSNTCTITVTNPSVTVPSGGGSSGGASGAVSSGSWSAWYAIDPVTHQKHYYATEKAAVEAGQKFSNKGGGFQLSEIGYVNSDTGSHKTGDAFSQTTTTSGNSVIYTKTNGVFEATNNTNSSSSSTRVGYTEYVTVFHYKTTVQYNPSSGRNEKVTQKIVDRTYTIDHTPPAPPSGGGGGGGGYYCFTAGTKVQTENGPKNIEDIKVGEKVLSYNELTHETEYKTVETTFVHNKEKEIITIYKIKVNNEIIEATGNHPFYVDGIYKEARELKVGDKLLMKDGSLKEIEEISYYKSNVLVYNIKVEDNHNYYVGEGYLAHNKGGPVKGTGCFIAGTKVQTENGLKNIEDIKVGEKVLSYNENTNSKEYNKVSKTYKHDDNIEDLYEIYYDNEIIKVTSKHPVYVNLKLRNNIILQIPTFEINSNKYNGKQEMYNNYTAYRVYAKNLQIGDYLLGSDGNYHKIIQIKHYEFSNPVYNIEIENNYNYYVGTNGILVHN